MSESEQPIRILVAEDDLRIRTVLDRLLQAVGYEVEACTNGREALDAIEARPFDLIITDINMPEMNGEELLNRIRENPATSGLKVIVVSTESNEGRIARLREKGAAFVHKPFTPERLREVVIEVTGISDEE